MQLCLLAFSVLSADALRRLAPSELISKDSFDGRVSKQGFDGKNKNDFDKNTNQFDKEAAAENWNNAWSAEAVFARKATGVVPELVPSDFKDRFIYKEWKSMATKGLYFVGVGIVWAGIAVIYWGRGFTTVFSIIAFVTSLSLMSNSIRSVFVLEGFRYPQFVTASHQLCTGLAGFTMLQFRQATTGQKITYPSITTMVEGIMPVALCFACSLGCSNLALLYTSTHFYEMLTPCSALVTFGLGVFMGRVTNPRLLPPVLLVTASLPIVAFGDLQFSLLGLFFVMAGVLSRAGKAQVQSMLMSPGAMSQTFDPLELACWTTSATFSVMLLWCVVAEGGAPFWEVKHLSIVTAVLLSCLNAIVLNISAMFVMKELGPVASQIIGELKGVLACLGAVVAFGEIISIPQMLAYGMAIVGVHWYNHTDMHIREETVAQAKKLVENQQAEKA